MRDDMPQQGLLHCSFLIHLAALQQQKSVPQMRRDVRPAAHPPCHPPLLLSLPATIPCRAWLLQPAKKSRRSWAACEQGAAPAPAAPAAWPAAAAAARRRSGGSCGSRMFWRCRERGTAAQSLQTPACSATLALFALACHAASLLCELACLHASTRGRTRLWVPAGGAAIRVLSGSMCRTAKGERLQKGGESTHVVQRASCLAGNESCLWGGVGWVGGGGVCVVVGVVVGVGGWGGVVVGGGGGGGLLGFWA